MSTSQKSLAIDDPGGSAHLHAGERRIDASSAQKSERLPMPRVSSWGEGPGGEGVAPSRQRSFRITSIIAGRSPFFPGCPLCLSHNARDRSRIGAGRGRSPDTFLSCVIQGGSGVSRPLTRKIRWRWFCSVTGLRSLLVRMIRRLLQSPSSPGTRR
jgi:hypothetical protein